MTMESKIQQIIWDLMEKVNIDLEEDNDASEYCDEAIDEICRLIKD